MNVSHLTDGHLLNIARWYGNTLSRAFVVLYEHNAELDNHHVISEGPDILLRHCPNLSELTYVGSVDSKWIQNLEDIRHKHLTDLTIHICNCDGDLDTEALLTATPNLQHLAMTLSMIGNDYHLPSKLLRLCPELVSLFLTGNCDLDTEIRDIHRRRGVERAKCKVSNEPGLEDLIIHDALSKYPIAPSLLCAFGRQLATVLRSLSIAGYEMFNAGLAAITLSSLTHFTVGPEYLYMRDIDVHTPNFFQRSIPNLTSLDVRAAVDSVNMLLLLLMDSARHLEEIRFSSSCSSLRTNWLI